MPKVGMEPIRKAALVEATIHEIGAAGSLEVTVGQIARRAGVSPGLAHHYFGGKEQIFLAAMRHILTIYGRHVREELKRVDCPRGRVEAIIRASFDAENFRPEVISAWLNFYVKALTSEQSARLLRIYQKRLRSNLRAGLRPLIGDEADRAAEGLAAMIDGFYIRHALQGSAPEGDAAIAMVSDYLSCLIGAAT